MNLTRVKDDGILNYEEKKASRDKEFLVYNQEKPGKKRTDIISKNNKGFISIMN